MQGPACIGWLQAGAGTNGAGCCTEAAAGVSLMPVTAVTVAATTSTDSGATAGAFMRIAGTLTGAMGAAWKPQMCPLS